MKRSYKWSSSKTPFTKAQGNSLQAEQLEDRVMFDAVPDAAALAAAEEGATAEDVPADVQAAEQQEQQADVSRELVLINGNVEDAEQLLAEFFAENQNRSFELAFLDPNADGIEQITDLLNSTTGGYDSIHIVSHGDDARVQLGNTWLNSDNLADHAVQISQWSNAFSENGDLLLYGCNLAESADGQQLISSISTLTGADVAASDDLTGHAELSGDWDLEVATGVIETVALDGGDWRDQLALDAQIVGGEAFVRGNFVEMGLNAGGSFGAVNANRPAGFHTSRANSGKFGFISNPQDNNWATYDGDFFAPGTPLEGFSVEFNGTAYRNDTARGVQIPGSITGVNASDTLCGEPAASATWGGAIGGLDVDRKFTIAEDGLYILMETTLTNTTGSAMNNVYWGHNVDPDNDQPLHGSYATTNTIVSQPTAGSNVAVVRAIQTQNDGSSVSLVADDARVKVTQGGFDNHDPSDIYNGVGLNQGVGSTVSADQAISLAFDLGTIAAGESVTFYYAYNLEVDPTAALGCVAAAANPAPAINLDPNNSGGGGDDGGFESTFTEGGSAVSIADTDVTVDDGGANDIASATFIMGAISDGDSEILTVGGTPIVLGTTDTFSGITIGGTSFDLSYDSSTKTLTVVNSVSPTTPIPAVDLQALIDGMTYEHDSIDPTAGNRTIAISATDDAGNAGTPVIATVEVVAVNSDPVAGVDNATVTEGGTVTGNVLDNDSDVESTTLTVSNFTVAGVGTVLAGETANIPGVGLLTLNPDGTFHFAPQKDYFGTIPNVTYTVIDEDGGSDTGTLNLGPIADINDQPVIDLDFEAAGEMISNGDFAAGSTDWVTNLGGSSSLGSNINFVTDNAVETVTQTGISGWDEGNAPSGAAQLSLDATFLSTNAGQATLEIEVGGVVYATATTSVGAGPVTITYLNGASGNLSQLSTQGTFENWVIDLPADVVSTGDLVFRFDASTSLDDFTIDNVSAISTADGNGLNNSVEFTEGDSPIAVAASDANVFDAMENDIASLAVSLGNFLDSGDELIAIDGTDLTYGTPLNSTTFSVTGITGDLTVDYDGANGINITRTDGNPFTAAEMKTLIKAFTYEHTSNNPTDGDRTLSFVATDTSNVDSPTAVATIDVIPVNSDPVANADGPLTVHGGHATLLNVITNDTDPEGNSLSVSAIIDPSDAGNPIVIGNGVGETPVGTEITLTSGTKVTVNGDGTLTVLSEVTASGPETFSYEVSDGNSGTDTAVVSLELNAAPILNIDPNNTTGGADDGNFNSTFTELSGPVPVTANTSGDEPTILDDGTALQSMTVTVAGVNDGLYEVLVIGGTEVPLVVGGPYSVEVNGLNYDLNLTASGPDMVVTIDPPGAATFGPLVDFQELLGDMTYENKLAEPTDGDRTFTITASDGFVESAPVVSTISVPNLFMAPDSVSGNEDVSGGVSLGITNAGATAQFAIDLNNAPVGTTLSHGSDPDMDGIWTVDAADIEDINIIPPTHYSGDFSITVTSNDEVEAVAVSLTPQPDGLTLNLDDASGDEDTAIDIPFTTNGASPRDVSLVDVTDNDTDAGEDSPETLSQLELSGIPVGATISDGTNTFTATLGNTAIDVATWDLSALTITPPENFHGTITLTTTAESTEPDNSDTLTTMSTFDVVVNPINDLPTISDDDATPSYTQNTASVALDPSLTITDADDTDIESAVVTISNEDQLNDLLTLNTAGTMAAVNAGITVTAYNQLTGELTLSGTATLEEYEAVLEGLLFSSSSGTTGNRTVSIIVNDGEDNSNVGEIEVAFTPDTTPPAAPSVTGISDDSGISATDGITNDNTPIITGTFDESDTDVLTVDVNGTTYTLDLGTPANSDPEITSDGSGNWTLDLSTLPELGDGVLNVVASATDLAGNTSTDPTANEFLIDTSTTNINTPTVNTLITNDRTPTLTGTWDEVSAATHTVTVNGTTYTLGVDDELTTDGSGNWTLNLDGTYLLTENTYDVSVVLGDSAGNTISDETVGELTIDFTDPGTPTVDNLVTNDVTPTLTGTWDEDDASILKVTVNGFEYVLDLNSPGTSDEELTTDGDGSWTLELDDEPALLPGNYNVTAVNIDEAGNDVIDITAGELTIDVTAPLAATTPPDLTSPTDTGVADDDDLTNDTTPDFTGEGGEPGSTATIYATPTDESGTPTGPPVIIGTGPVDGSGEYNVPNDENNPLADGPFHITVTFTDLAENESDPSPVLSIIVDTTAPLELEIDDADVEEIEGDHVVNLAESPDVTISGDGVEPTSTLVVTMEDQNGNTIGPVDATVNPDGTWTIPDQDFTGLDDGPVTVTAVETDAAGNVGPDVVTTLELDTTPPAQPPVVDMTTLTDSAGASDTDDLTNDTTPTFDAPAGTGVPGDVFTLYVDGSPVATGSVNPDGSYELTPTSPLAEGPHDITVSFTDPAGNEGPQSEVLPIIIDTIAPTNIAIDDADVEEIEEDHVVNLAEVEHVTISGDGVEPTSTVAVIISDENDNDVGSIAATVNLDGTWTIPDQDLSSLDDGPITVSATETDAAGNVGDPVETVLEKDTVAPEAATVAPNLTDDTDTGASNSDDLTNDNTPTFDGPAGTGEPDAAVTLYIDGTPVGTSTVNPDGSYEVTVDEVSSLDDGPHDVTVTFTDPAGNEGDPSPVLPIIVDTAAPLELEIDDADVEEIEGDHVVNLAESPDVTLSGDGVEPTSSVAVTIGDENSNEIGPIAATVNPDGTWTIPDQDLSGLDDGPITVTAVETDAAGNVGPDVVTTLTLDTTPPEPPITPNLTDPTDSGASNVDDITNDITPNFDAPAGTGVAGDAVTIYAVPLDSEGDPTGPAVVLAEGTVNPDGSYEVNVPSEMLEGDYNITATFTDPAGNESDESPVIVITIDTTAPELPTLDSPLEIDDVVNLVESTDVLSEGTAEANSEVEVTFDDGNPLTDPVIVTVFADESGDWTLTDDEADLSTLDDGPISVSVTATDVAGNTSSPATEEIELDTTPPTDPAIAPNLTDETDSAGASNEDEITNVNTPTFDAPAGTGEPDATVTLYVDGTPVGSATVNPDGSYEVSVDEESPLEDGPHDVTVTFTDPAGNESGESPILEIIVDTEAPTDLEIDAPVEEDQVVNLAESPTVEISGTDVEPTSTVEVTFEDEEGNTVGPVAATVNPDGTWTIDPTDLASLDDGEITVTGIETDAADNVGEPVETTILLDTRPPAPPTIDEPIEEDDVVNIAESPDVLISGTGEPEATVEVTIDDGNPLTDPIVVTLQIDEEGKWTLSGEEVDVNSLDDGTLTIIAVVTDPAGNPSEPTSTTIEKDTDAPDAPADPNMTDDTDHGEFSDDEVTNDNTPTFDAPPGTGKPGDTVTLYVDETPVGTATVNEDGSYEVTPDSPIADGEHVVTLTFTDPAGNEGEPSNELPIVIDTEAPTGLTLDAPIEEDDVSNKAESPTVDFSGDGVEPTSIVEVTLTDDEGNELGPIAATVNPDGTWELPEVDITSLLDGDITVSVIETDLAGNPPEPVTAVIEKDTVAPDDIAYSLTPDLDAGSDSGPSDEDEITFNNVSTFTAGPGSANPDDSVMVNIDGEPAGTAIVNEDGSFAVTVDETLEDGEYEVTLTFTDPAGNESVPTVGLPITIDTLPPSTEDIEFTDAGPEFVEGTGEPGATVNLLDDEGQPITDSEGKPVVALVDEEGNWSIEDVSPKFQSGDTVTVVITDPAGNIATTELKVEFFGFDSFNNLSGNQGTFDDIATASANGFFNASREVLFSSMVKSLGSQPIISGVAVPGTILIGRVYGSDGAVLGEAQITADGAGNWLMNFGSNIDDDTPTIIIEHVATEAVPVGSARFNLSDTTYTQFGFGSSRSRQGSSPGAVGSLPAAQLLGDHQQNLNPLSVL